MSTASMRVDCRKFTPNIFNKTKCSNCFRQKEEHSAEALESNRAARKISKCGYLFVAPGWDFSNPINRTKRWQRRWFVLYDDGELSYSVDEHPETVPQASIDMNKVLDVTDAEDVTGNSYSLAITAPDTVHYVKGTCREEAKWWREVLSIYPRSKGRHKRNATFPGSQTTALLQQTPLGCRSPAENARPRFNSCHGDSGILVRPPSSTWLCVDEENIFTGPGSTDQLDSPIPASPTTTTTSPSNQSFRDSAPSSTKPTITGLTYKDTIPTSPTQTPLSALSSLTYRESPPLGSSSKGVRSSLSYRDSTPPSSPKSPMSFRESSPASSPKMSLSYRESSPPISTSSMSSLSSLSGQPATSSSPPTRDKLHAEEKARARREKRGRSLTEQIRREKLKDIADRLTSPRASPRASLPSSHPPPTRERDSEGDKHEDEQLHESPIRGDPDGCGLDPSTLRYSPSAELRVALPAEDLLNLKKGWLMKQAGTEWTKHWFVLRGAALMYYRDPTAEDKGILDGVLDLSSVRAVAELQVQRNHGFQIVCWDERRFVLSAVTAGIRSNWIAAIRRAAGLGESPSHPLTIGEKLERELQESNPHYFDPPSSLPTGLQRTSSTHSSCADASPTTYLSSHDGPGWGHPAATPLPPSPPLTRTPISRVKERAKTQVSRSRVYNKRSKSSPPTSRRNTLDTIRVPPVRHDTDMFPRRQSFSKVLDEPAKSGDWTDSSADKTWSLKLEETSLMRGRSVDSLSDLTNIDLDLDLSTLDKARVVEEYEELKGRFEKAVMEIRAMKRELRQSHRACDELELTSIRLRQDAKVKEEADTAEAKLMAARVQDLALKLSAAEKQVRALKQKSSKAESREKRRSLSLKGRESFQIGREVEEKLTELENKLAAMESGQKAAQQPAAKSRIRRKSLDSATSEPITVLLRLTSLEGRLATADKRKQNDVRQAASSLIGQLENMLRVKLTELAERRQRLAASGNLDTSAKLRLAAERIAVESVLVRKVLDAARSFGQGKPLPLASDIQEIQAMMAAVRRRMRGEEVSLENPLDCLTDCIARALTAAGDVITEAHKVDPALLECDVTDLNALLQNQRTLHDEVKAFRAATIPQVARGLTLETLCLSAEYEEGRSRGGENSRLREAWAQAQEALNRELVQAELSHVAMRWTGNAEVGARMSWLGLSDATREACATTVTESLRGIMDDLINELTVEYEQCLTCMRRPSSRTHDSLEKEASESRASLERLVSVIAVTALIDARLNQVAGDVETPDGRPVVRGVSLKSLTGPDVETECLYLFHRIAAETASSADALCVSEACSAVASCVEKTMQLTRLCGVDAASPAPEGVNWASLAEQCEWLSATLVSVLERVGDGSACARCPLLQASLEELELKQEEEAQRLKDRHEWQLQELRGELESQRDSLVCQHEIEQAQLMEKARRLERRLGTLDGEYAHQMENLRAAYQKTLSAHLNRDGDGEESMRQRYQAEIQQLRALCEKGLIAVDNSHRRIIAQMEEKHRQELAMAASEKDQALAEETQATLAALDAMRKAHETEVQREVSKFKTEWLRRMQSAHDVTALHEAHE